MPRIGLCPMRGILCADMAITRPLTDSEQQSLIAILPRLTDRDHALILIALKTGFRVSEILCLQVRDVWHSDRPRPSLTVERRRMKFGRGARRHCVRSRTVPIGPALSELLRWYVPLLLSRGATPHSSLFPSRKGGGAIRRCHALRALHAAFSVAGIEPGGWGMHALRKSFCCAIYQKTHDLVLTKTAMGHASIATTQRYLDFSAPAAADAILALG